MYSKMIDNITSWCTVPTCEDDDADDADAAFEWIAAGRHTIYAQSHDLGMDFVVVVLVLDDVVDDDDDDFSFSSCGP